MTDIRTGIYPGTFDPVTNGHVDIISRAAKVVDRLIIGIAANDGKDPMFSLEERMAMMSDEISAMDGDTAARISIKPFANLLVAFAEGENACVIIRGLRAISDFEFEFQMAAMNSHLNSRVETMFLMASDRHQFISSRFVKEIGRLGGDIGKFVSAPVKERLVQRFAEDSE
ncbi:MAG: pantetheine-phosphate adenylyltransferase [Rhodospirillales bacterium]|nr:pantetheine-phosphate adenylyltransferase [Rhodospirillales bacterium]